MQDKKQKEQRVRDARKNSHLSNKFDSKNQTSVLHAEFFQIHCVKDICSHFHQAVRRTLKTGLKTHKKRFLTLNCPYIGQPDNQISWATSMPFESIYRTNPRTAITKIFAKKLRIGGVENLSFFSRTFWFFFLKKKMLHPHENQSTFIM